MAEPEHWLRGPMEGIAAPLQPVAHSLAQALDDLPGIVNAITQQQLWAKPAGAASIGFHLKHMAGSLDRLYTYARGEKLDDGQLMMLRHEHEPDSSNVDELLAVALAQFDKALQQLRSTDVNTLDEICPVGRAGIPATQLGLLFHGAEHTQRHLGALIATVKFVRECFR